MAGMTSNSSLTSSIIQYVIFLVTTGAILPFIDRVGRRQLLIGGALICMFLHYTTAGVMAVHSHHVDAVNGDSNLKMLLPETPGKAVIALSYIFTGIYGLTWAPTGWIYASEVFPLKYRAKGVGLSAATNWVRQPTRSLVLLYHLLTFPADLQFRSCLFLTSIVQEHHLADIHRE